MFWAWILSIGTTLIGEFWLINMQLIYMSSNGIVLLAIRLSIGFNNWEEL